MNKLYVLLLLLCLQGCIDFPHGDSIRNNTVKLKVEYPKVERVRKLNNVAQTYLYQNNRQSDWLVVFVHGSPGNANAFAHLMRHTPLLKNYSLIAVDRPGYERAGDSKPERSLAKQSETIHHIVSEHRANKKVILVGHSFGGPVIARMAVDYPDIYQRLVMVAASVDPQREKTKWFQIPANWKVFRWMVPDALDTSNQEILALKKELITLKKDLIIKNKELHKNTIGVYIVHGTADKLVPYDNVHYMRKIYGKSVKKVIRLEGVNHFIPWSHSQEIIKAVDYFSNFFTPNITDATR